jgi:hypothetical protein
MRKWGFAAVLGPESADMDCTPHPMIPLSRGTIDRIHALFPQPEWDGVAQALVERCGDNLPLVNTTYVALTERIRFAVLKLSEGSREELDHHLQAASRDWRDVLLAAGFGTDFGAHLRWMPEPGPFHVSRHRPANVDGTGHSKGRKP